MQILTLRSRILSLSVLAAFAVGSLGQGEVSRSVEAISQEKESSARTRFAFHYAPSLTAREIAWYSRFHVLVTHDPLPREQVRQLHRAGTKLVLYEWAAAFYDALRAP